MKKMLSLAAMFAVLSYAAPASAELKIGGDAAVRARAQFNSIPDGNNNSDDMLMQYRVRLKAAADLGDGYFFKAMIQNEGAPAGWTTVANNSTDQYNLQVSNFYFGRALKECNYSIGRLPLGSLNNPIFDLALYAVPTGGVYAVDIPVATYNFDRLFGATYGQKIGAGTLTGTLIVLDNDSITQNTEGASDGLLNDGYGLHLSYKTNMGNVTVEPQAFISLTDTDLAYANVSPNTFGLNATIPAGKSKIGVSGFYTVCKDNHGAQAGNDVDYTGYLLRLKGESGPVMAWVDYNHTNDNSGVANVDYDNLFVWAQYNFKVHESATGTVNFTPTIRYRASETNRANNVGDNDQLRAELYATVTF